MKYEKKSDVIFNAVFIIIAMIAYFLGVNGHVSFIFPMVSFGSLILHVIGKRTEKFSATPAICISALFSMAATSKISVLGSMKYALFISIFLSMVFILGDGIVNQEKLSKKLLPFVCCFVIFWGQISYINVYFDKSPPLTVPAQVVEKHRFRTDVSFDVFSEEQYNGYPIGYFSIRGKNHIDYGNWEIIYDDDFIIDEYDEIEIGDYLSVIVRGGYFHIPYAIRAENNNT